MSNNHVVKRFNGKFFKYGGTDGANYNASIYMSDDGITWTLSSHTLPDIRYSFSIAVIGSTIYYFGGVISPVTSYPATIYKSTDGETFTLHGTNAAVQRREFTSHVMDGNCYFSGGRDSGGALNDTYSTADFTTFTLKSAASFPTARFWVTLYSIDGVLYGFGGYDTDEINAVEKSVDNGTNWTTMPGLSFGTGKRFFNGVGGGYGKAILMGGINTDGTKSNEIFEFDGTTLTKLTDFTFGARTCSCADYDGAVYNFGGAGATYFNDVNRYNIEVNTFALMASRLVAEGDGVSAYMTAPSGIDMTGSWTLFSLFSLDSITRGISNFILSEAVTTTATERFYIQIYNNTLSVQIGTGAGGGGATGLLADTWYMLKMQYNSVTGKINGTLTPDSGSAIVLTEYTVTGLTDTSGIWRIMRSQGGAYFEGKLGTLAFCSGLVDSYVEADIFHATLEGNAYDLVSKTYLTNTGVDLFAVHTNVDNGTYSSNLDQGFDLYYDEITGLLPWIVPYVDGVPVVSSVGGYTLDSEHPALEKGHNMADVAVLYSAGLTGDIMNKDNGTVWKTTIQSGVNYNSSYPRLWAPEEHNVDYIATHIQPAYLNTMYLATQETGYLYSGSEPIISVVDGRVVINPSADVEKFMAFLMYGTEKTTAEELKVVKYLKKQTFREK